MEERADKGSIQLLLEAFNHFSRVSGLQANLKKSSFYVAGVPEEFKRQILQQMQFTMGEIPFKYLGVPLSSRKLNIQQCLPLVEKIVTRIRCWSSKWLSYSGRLQLIKSVLYEMQTYWGQVFLLPQKIVKMVNTVRRIFLWTGSAETSKKALVAWDTMCLPKAAGELNIIDFAKWNKAAICKLLWALSHKKDTLWVQWTHFSNFIWSTILQWLGITRQVTNWADEVKWMAQHVHNGRLRASILGFLSATVIYHIWQERNARRFQEKEKQPVQIIRDIILQLHIRGQGNCKWSRLLDRLNQYPDRLLLYLSNHVMNA
ncbi:uncharacterized protein LOC132621967 [Lycium barbarum]|uniref:uncharacterized protein LOC132621967 n=1 Tax=Lycium barbarum TaxID=112863 RepID=UPI00293E0A21|nr:uncharacterized protein LOC132621967 [Lycium barbarum]